MVRAIRERFEIVQERIEQACQRASRNSKHVTLIAVTKTFPAMVVEQAIEAGLRDFGENKVQELVTKASAIAPDACRWHMIGHLQRNKARQVVVCAESFHALDSARLAGALNRHAIAHDRILPCFVQVNISRESTKSGLDVDDVGAFIERMQEWPKLKLTGLMTLASPAVGNSELRKQFRQMRDLRDSYRHLGCNELSMGMSGDYEIAIEEGATHVRVGSAIFGPRIRNL